MLNQVVRTDVRADAATHTLAGGHDNARRRDAGLDDHQTEPGDTSTGTSTGTSRDRGLDLLRGLALGRVFLWHATGYTALTWVAALPVMVFLSGMLLGRSVDKRGRIDVVTGRLRRLLVPLWAYGAAAWTIMIVQANIASDPIPWRNTLAWIVPVVDPHGTGWENGWLSQPLWYVRMLLWLFATLPLLAAAARRAPKAAMALCATLTVAAELTLGTGWWPVQDYLLFAGFLIAGLAVHAGTLPSFNRSWVRLTLPGAVLAAGWVLWQGGHAGAVNDSHTLHLAVGTCTVGLAGLGLPALRRLAERFPRPVDLVARRSLSIYLWHPSAIAATVAVTAAWRAWSGDSIAVRLTVAVLAAAVTASVVPLVGRVEDLAARRHSSRRPATLNATCLPDCAGGKGGRSCTMKWKLAVPGTTTLVCLILATTAPLVPKSDTAAFALPTPSQQPEAGDYAGTTKDPIPGLQESGDGDAESADRNDSGTGTAATRDEGRDEAVNYQDMAPGAGPALAAELQALVDSHIAAYAEAGFGALVIRPGVVRWAGAGGETPHTADHEFAMMSITKSFTAALVLQAADTGRINLDEPVGPLEQAPWFDAAEQLTWRQLLDHSAGLRHYADTTIYKDDWQQIDSWQTALEAVDEDGATMFTPGTQHVYSSTNYIVLGLALGQLYGEPIEELITERLLEPLGLDDTHTHPPAAGSPATGTGGMTGTLADMARWGLALWGNGPLIGPNGKDVLYDVDPDTMLGPGSIAFCPCGTAADGAKNQSAIGYNGGTASIRYFPQWNTIVIVSAQGSIWDEGEPDALNELSYALARAANADNQ